MDVRAFCSECLSALARADSIERVALQVEGFVVSGRAFLPEGMFLEIYFNEVTQTTAFALIKERARVWGIDRDNIRGWHRHPVREPDGDVEMQRISVSDIVEERGEALRDVKPGEMFTADNMRSIRTGYGLHTRYLDEIIGRCASQDIKRGTPLSWDLVTGSEL